MLAFREDIERRGFWVWMKAHTSFMKPLHRYEGTLELDDETMKELMKEAVNKVYFLLKLRDETRDGFFDLVELIYRFYGLEEWDDPEIESVYEEWEVLLKLKEIHGGEGPKKPE